MMTNEHALAKAKAATTYNAAADYFDHPISSFWSCFGRKTIERLALTEGEWVLDVCAGSGASALPAAASVGPNGKVIAVDLAEQLISLAQAKAKATHLHNIEFRVADMLELGYADGHFDAVVCVFGIFFVPDMQAALRELWRMVKPGGRMALRPGGLSCLSPPARPFGMLWDTIGRT